MNNTKKAQALLLDASQLLAEALNLLNTPADVPSAASDAEPQNVPDLKEPSTPSAWRVPGTPLRLEDLNFEAIAASIADLGEVFDTYHVVEHPSFRETHCSILDRPAINQLTGKFLRRHEGDLSIRYLGQRGRVRSALWQKV